MNALLDLDISTGWVPVTLTAVGAVGMCWLLLLRPLRSAVMLICGALVGTVAVIVVARWLIEDVIGLVPDPIPLVVYAWSAAIMFGMVIGVFRLVRDRGVWRRVVTLLAVLCVTVAGLAQINAHFGEYPTVRSLLGITGAQAVDLGALPPTRTVPLANWRPPPGLPAEGRLATVDIPATKSRFTARPAHVYLPPAYFADPRPVLPVLVLIAGQPGSPEDWALRAASVRSLNDFAAQHHGVAPIVIAADGTGSELGNPLCMDSRLGNAATYLTADIAEWARTRLDAETDRRKWAVGGLSYGGTCALQLVANFPDQYPTFLNMSGQYEPTLGDRSRTIGEAFGGDATAFAAVNPVDLLRHRKYPGVAGVFVVGSDDHAFQPGLERLVPLARQSGMDVRLSVIPGGHDFRVWATGLREQLPWLGRRMGIDS